MCGRPTVMRSVLIELMGGLVELDSGRGLTKDEPLRGVLS